MFRSAAKQAPRFRPAFEALEDRYAPATVGPVLNGTVLTITAKSAGSTIVVSDNGAGFGNNITVNFDNNKPAVFASVTTINIVGSNNRDKVTYNLTSAFGASNRVVNINLADGNDVVNFNASNINISTGASLSFNVQQAGGSNTVAALYSGVINGTLNFNATADLKPSNVCAQFQVQSGSTGNLNANLTGGAGKDYLTLAVCQANTGDPVVITAIINAVGKGNQKDILAITPGVQVNSLSGEKFTPKILTNCNVCADS
jgi:hypothetical protein